MSDLIDRQAAIDTLNEYFARIGKLKRRGLTKGEKAISLDTVGAIKTLPPAQPERKTGKWNFIGNQMFECSECGTCYTQSQFYQMRVRISDTEFPKFCPNCGADMREGQDG